jgi:hypothetical protein
LAELRTTHPASPALEARVNKAPFSSLFVLALLVISILFVGVSVLLDSATEFGSDAPVSANIVAGVLGLPISGIVAALVVDFVLRSQRRRQWGMVYTHVSDDVLPEIGAVLQAVEECQPSQEGEIRRLGAVIVAGLRERELTLHAQGVVSDADLGETLRVAIDDAVTLLGDASPTDALHTYAGLNERFADLDLLDDPRVKLAVLRVRRASEHLQGVAADRHRINLRSLEDLRQGGTWDGDMVSREGGAKALRMEELEALFDECSRVSVAAARLKEQVSALRVAVEKAVSPA